MNETTLSGLRLDRLGGFVVRLAVLYGLLILPWPGWRATYAGAYRTAANVIFGSFGPDGIVVFREHPQKTKWLDTEIAIRRRSSPAVGTTDHNSRLTGYLPAALMLALAGATPMAFRKRIPLAFWGLLMVHGFIVARLYVDLLYWFSADGGWTMYHPGPWARAVLNQAFEFLVAAPTCSFLVPVLIWLLLLFLSGRQEETAVPDNAPKRA